MVLGVVLLFWVFWGPATQLPNKSHRDLFLLTNAWP